MGEDRALRLLLDACLQTLADARTGETWLIEVVLELEQICVRLHAQLGPRPA
jgi:hypothetical protein